MKKYSVPKYFQSSVGHNSLDHYQSLRENANQDSNSYWESVANRIDWFDKWTTVNNTDYSKAHIEWFSNGKLNASYNCIDRHIENGLGEKIALIWQSNDPTISKNVTYNELLEKVSLFANGLKRAGIKKGDRVCIYMQMIPEAIVAMLACARIGAIHSVVFAGFSAQSLKDRIIDSQSVCVITTDGGYRRGKHLALKAIVDEALIETATDCVTAVLVHQHSNQSFNVTANRDILLADVIHQVSTEHQPEVMDSEDPLFILYTTGTTGEPKGILHTSGGYLTHAQYSTKEVFDINKIPSGWMGLDCGPQSLKVFKKTILLSKTILWNGPLGFFEKKPFDEGTNFVVKAVKNNKNKNFFSVAGGGDTISALKQMNAFQFFSFISTGGGAFLEFIRGQGLPGLDSLNE